MHYYLIQMFIKVFQKYKERFAVCYKDIYITYYQLFDEILTLKRTMDKYGKEPKYLFVQAELSINYIIVVLYGILSQHVLVFFTQETQFHAMIRLRDKPVIIFAGENVLSEDTRKISPILGYADVLISIKDFSEYWSAYDYQEKVVNNGKPDLVLNREFEDFINNSDPEDPAFIIAETIGKLDNLTEVKLPHLLHNLTALLKSNMLDEKTNFYQFLPINFFPRVGLLYPLLLGNTINLIGHDKNTTTMVSIMRNYLDSIINGVSYTNSGRFLLLAHQFENIFNKYCGFVHTNFWQTLRKYWITRFIFKLRLKNKLNKIFNKRIQEIVIINSHLNRSIEQMLKEVNFPITVTYGDLSMGIITYAPSYDRPIFSRGTEITNTKFTVENPNSENVGQIVITHVSEHLNLLDITSHIGRIKDGYLYIYSDLKGLISLDNNFELYPETIEDVLNTISYIKESIVLKITDDYEEKLIAFVNPTDDVYIEEMTSIEYKQVLNDINSKVNKELPIYCEIKNIAMFGNDIHRHYNGSINRELYNNAAMLKISKFLTTTP